MKDEIRWDGSGEAKAGAELHRDFHLGVNELFLALAVIFAGNLQELVCVVSGTLLQPGDSLFDGETEAVADFEVGAGHDV